ncbi:pentatricopeptide repeat-containing protein, mitochondrial [Cinnamomum micranthum f. kanehirae]|uniref:Pentatricopeptide repeat-containing protein, mitochondrial n=1 Tax=Cinnamomum micranthum f. kanehirae TaxID=337451 RepID=A0A3S3ML85_9MAGN|nr:pentatricopeptide repeat-containing protein, mitochondrial [Cinnamomum micranthum f. kanehirae]
MWSFRRTSKLCALSSLLQTHFSLPRIMPTELMNSNDFTEFRLFGGKSNLGLFVSRSSKPFCSSPNTLATTLDAHLIENEDNNDTDNDAEDSDGENDFEVIEPIEKDEILIQNAETILGFLRGFGSNGVEAKRRLEESGVPASPELVAEVLSRVRNDWEAAFTFFLWAGKQPGYVHSFREYHTMISILGKMRKFDTAWSLIDEMKGGRSGPSLVTPQTLLIMIRRYCAAHDVGKAVGTFYAFKRYGFKAGVEEFQDLLSALCRYKNVRDAEHLLFCNESVFPIDMKSLNIVLNGWCNVMVNLRQAKRFWWDMGKRGVTRDVYCYGSMISCYSKAGSLRDVLKLFNQMKELGIDPDRKVYNAVIYALAKGKCMKEALSLVKAMEERGCVPNTVTYNSLIRPLCKARRVDDARAVFDEMLKRGLSPSDRTYHAFFAISRTAEEVFEFLEKMKDTGSGPTTDTYIMLIRKFCRWRQHENVFKLWDGMVVNGPSPDRSSYIVLIHGLFLNGKLNDAYRYYLEMKEKGFLPEPKTDEMIKAWVSGQETVKHQMLELKGMKGDQCPSKTSDTSSAIGLKRDFLRQPETIRVTRERGFSFR